MGEGPERGRVIIGESVQYTTGELELKKMQISQECGQISCISYRKKAKFPSKWQKFPGNGIPIFPIFNRHLVTDAENGMYNAAFSLACRSPHCYFDGDFCTTGKRHSPQRTDQAVSSVKPINR